MLDSTGSRAAKGFTPFAWCLPCRLFLPKTGAPFPPRNQSRGLEWKSRLYTGLEKGNVVISFGGGGLRFPLCAETPAFSFFSHRIYRDEEVDPGPIDPKPAGGESFSGRGGGREEVSPRLLLPPPITSNQVVVFVFFTHSLKNKPSCFFCWTWNGS